MLTTETECTKYINEKLKHHKLDAEFLIKYLLGVNYFSEKPQPEVLQWAHNGPSVLTLKNRQWLETQAMLVLRFIEAHAKTAW